MSGTATTGYKARTMPRTVPANCFALVMKRLTRTLAAVISAFPIFVLAQTVAFTFDDGLNPRVQSKAAQWNDAILSALGDAQLHAMFFPAGIDVDSPEGRALVAQWVAAGHAIGNHTYSHWNLGLSTTSVEKFEADVLREQAVFDALSTWRKRLRFPYLKEGDTEAKRDAFRAWMKTHGYLPAPVSIDTSDWYYNQRFLKVSENDFQKIAAFRRLYLAHLWDRANYYDTLARQVLGHSPEHILLLHTNAVNARFLPDVIQMFRARHWKLVDAEQAFADPLYQKQPHNVPAGESIVWALARDAGVDGLRYPGEDGDYEKPVLDASGF
jgi:peptidoglycan/xylan/chitin deacetylase (PgdA/CDA1 family)